MSRRLDVEGWPYNVMLTCKKCGRTLLRYRSWRDGDRDGVTGDDRWEPADAQIVHGGKGGKFVFTCVCRARPQVLYETVFNAATPYSRNTLQI